LPSAKGRTFSLVDAREPAASARPVSGGGADDEAAPKLEKILLDILLKEAKIMSEGDPRTPLASQALADHIVGTGAFELGFDEALESEFGGIGRGT
jgi:hypothetical protein